MYLCSRSRCRINIETMETSGIPFPGRDKSLLDTWGKHQKCLSSRMQHPFKMYFCTDFHKHAKRPFKCARPYKHNNKPLELTEAERGISNPSTRASPLGHPFVPFFPPLLAPPPPTPGSKFSREMLASNARANLIRKNAFHPVETRIIRSNFVNVRNVLFFYSHSTRIILIPVDVSTFQRFQDARNENQEMLTDVAMCYIRSNQPLIPASLFLLVNIKEYRADFYPLLSFYPKRFDTLFPVEVEP